MKLFDENQSKENYSSSQNRSSKLYIKGRISIEDIDLYSNRVRINSPRSLVAMKRLGVNNQDLEYLEFKEFLHKFPELIRHPKEIQIIKYNYMEELRKKWINQLRIIRNEIAKGNGNPAIKRCLSSKLRNARNSYFNSNQKNYNNLEISFEKKDIDNFNRMRKINKTELSNRMQLELKKELLKIIINEKEEIENENLRSEEKEKFKSQKRQIKLNILNYEEKMRQEKKNAKSERKAEEMRIKKQIKDTKNQENKEKKKLKEAQEVINENDRRRYDFLRNAYSTKEKNRLMLSRKINKAKNKRERFIKWIQNEKRKYRLNKHNKRLEFKGMVDNHLKIIDCIKEQKRVNYEERLENERKKKIEEEILIQKLKDEERNNKIETELEKKMRITREKNELISNQRKEKIMNKILEKEINLERIREEKERQNLLTQGKIFQKNLDKEYRVKLITQILKNKREDIRDHLKEKDEKVEEFIQKRILTAKEKQKIYDEINKEKNQENEEFKKIWDKKNINKNILNSLKELSSGNKEIVEIVDKIDMVLYKKEEDNNDKIDNDNTEE